MQTFKTKTKQKIKHTYTSSCNIGVIAVLDQAESTCTMQGKCKVNWVRYLKTYEMTSLVLQLHILAWAENWTPDLLHRSMEHYLYTTMTTECVDQSQAI